MNATGKDFNAVFRIYCKLKNIDQNTILIKIEEFKNYVEKSNC